ncbi:MAG: response regulator [Acidimicrobiales bacterium]
MRAMIIDDSRAARSLMRRMLQRLGYEVTEAGDGLEALEAFKAGVSVDIALVDWNMPNMDGLELVKRVRKELRDADTTMMMVTSESDPKRVARALMAGADEYLVKPIDVAMLRDKFELLGLAYDDSQLEVA